MGVTLLQRPTSPLIQAGDNHCISSLVPASFACFYLWVEPNSLINIYGCLSPLFYSKFCVSLLIRDLMLCPYVPVCNSMECVIYSSVNTDPAILLRVIVSLFSLFSYFSQTQPWKSDDSCFCLHSLDLDSNFYFVNCILIGWMTPFGLLWS